MIREGLRAQREIWESSFKGELIGQVILRERRERKKKEKESWAVGM